MPMVEVSNGGTVIYDVFQVANVPANGSVTYDLSAYDNISTVISCSENPLTAPYLAHGVVLISVDGGQTAALTQTWNSALSISMPEPKKVKVTSTFNYAFTNRYILVVHG